MSDYLVDVMQAEVHRLKRELADERAAHRADNLRLVDARQEQVNRAITAEARVRELETRCDELQEELNALTGNA